MTVFLCPPTEVSSRIGAQLRRLEAETRELYRVAVMHRVMGHMSQDDLLVLVSLFHAARNSRIQWEERAGIGTAVDRANVLSITHLLNAGPPERKRGA